MFAVNTKEQPMLCRSKPTDPFVECTSKLICNLRDLGLAGFEYKPNTEKEGYLNTWYNTHDLMCMSSSEIGSIIGLFFVGFLLGAVIFFLPNTAGRKPAMGLSLVGVLTGAYLVVFSSSLTYVRIGYFFQGVLHQKFTVARMYATEMMENKHKKMAITVFSLFDACLMATYCGVLMHLQPDVIFMMKVHYTIGATACLLFFIAIPESPRYLFMKDPQSLQAIKILNYISWFNGCEKRIPETAMMDNIHQLIKDNDQFNDAKQVTLRHDLNVNIQEQIKSLVPEQKKSLREQVWSDFVGMFSGENRWPQLCSMTLVTGGNHLYYLCLYNSSQLNGNPL